MKKILVIEDEPEMRRNLATILRLEKLQPVVAENGRAGVEAAFDKKPDLILCDVMMPEMSGVEFYQKLQVIAPEQAARVVFVTGGVFSPEARAFLDAGKHRVIEKPVTQGALYKALLRIVPQRT